MKITAPEDLQSGGADGTAAQLPAPSRGLTVKARQKVTCYASKRMKTFDTSIPVGEIPLVFPEVDGCSFGEVDYIYLSAIRHTRPKIISYYLKQSYRTLLDISCGNSRDLHYYRWKGLNVTGTELTDELVANSKRYGFSCLKVDLEKESLPFLANSFDVITCTDVIEHLENPLKVMKEIVRVTKKIALITTPVGKSYNSPEHLHHWDLASLRKEVLAGIEQEDRYVITQHIAKPLDTLLNFRFFLIIIDKDRMSRGAGEKVSMGAEEQRSNGTDEQKASS